MAFLLKNLLRYRNSIATNVIDDSSESKQRRESLRPDFLRQLLDEAIYKNAQLDQTNDFDEQKLRAEKLDSLHYLLKDKNVFYGNPESTQSSSFTGTFILSYSINFFI